MVPLERLPSRLRDERCRQSIALHLTALTSANLDFWEEDFIYVHQVSKVLTLFHFHATEGIL